LFVLAIAVLSVNRAAAQNVAPEDRPAILVPKQPMTQKELDRRESLAQYAKGLQFEKQDRLVDALHAFQEAARLDPDAAPVFKAQVPILMAMSQFQDAINANTRVIELTPADGEAWYIQGRLFKNMGKPAEARAALRKGLATERAKARPELAHQMNFELAGILESEGSFNEAAEAYGQAASILEHPNHSLALGLRPEVIKGRIAEVYERIGSMYAKDRQFDKAVAAFNKVKEFDPASAGRVNLSLAQVLMESGKTAEALTAIDAYLATRPTGIEAYQIKIQLLERLGKAPQIFPWLDQASKNDPFNNALRLLLADRYVQAKQFANAERVYLEMHARAPDVEAYRSLFRIYKQEGGPGMEKLLQMLNRTIEQAAAAGVQNIAVLQGRPMLTVLQEDTDLGKQLTRHAQERIDTRKDLKWQTVHFLAQLAERQRQLLDAERFYRTSLKLIDTNSSNTFEVQNGLIRVLNRSQKFAEVEQICRARVAKAEGQERIGYLEELAKVLASMQRYKEALTEIDEAIKIASNINHKISLQFTRVRILMQKTDYKQAEEDCQAIFKDALLPSDMMKIHLQMSTIYTAMKKMDKAEEELQWVLRFDPGNAEASNDLGYLWADQNKNLKEAEEMIRLAIDTTRKLRKNLINPSKDEEMAPAAYIDSLGWVLFRKGEAQAARKELERATILPDGENAEIWDHLGDVYQQLRMPKEARNAWQRAIELSERERVQPTDERYLNLKRKVKMELPGN
jgi:tetratricopeptide (TPR) repeat protein